MSKMADIALQLDEQAVEYGLQGYQEALEQGFTYEVAEDGTATLTPPSNGLEMAHEAWLKERDTLCYELEMLASDTPYKVYKETLTKAVKFLREECHD